VRILALLALILALAGCHMLRPELPPWARPVPAKSEPAPEASPEAEASVVPEPATTPAPPPEPEPAPAPVTPPPPPPPPAVAPAPAGPPPPPVRAATPQPPAPASAPASAHAPAAPPAPTSPPLTASLPPAEARRLQEEAQRGIDDTEKLLRQLESRPLAPKDLETLRLAQGLVEQARKALGGQEYERAANLAAKARTLADDLSTRR
jgi:outer membrane biosynthesis protein TonB